VPGEASAPNRGVDVRLAGEVQHLETSVAQLLDVGQRGPDEVLDPGLASSPHRGGADLRLVLAVARFPEIGDDECPVCAFEGVDETLGIQQIRFDDFHTSRGQRPSRLAVRIPGGYADREFVPGQ
jgi:hypothetical protein